MTVSNALGSLSATSAQADLRLVAAVGLGQRLEQRRLRGVGRRASRSSTSAIAAVPRTVWSTEREALDDRRGCSACPWPRTGARTPPAAGAARSRRSAHLRQRGICSALGRSWMSRISLLTCSLVSVCASVVHAEEDERRPAPATSSRPTMMAMGLTAPRLKLPSSAGKACSWRSLGTAARYRKPGRLAFSTPGGPVWPAPVRGRRIVPWELALPSKSCAFRASPRRLRRTTLLRKVAEHYTRDDCLGGGPFDLGACPKSARISVLVE